MPPTGLDKFIQSLHNPYIYSNGKTWLSVDFGVCPLMFIGPKGSLMSKKCPGCYSVNVINVYPSVEKKIKNAPPQTPETLDQFKKDLAIIKMRFPEIKRLRFYALADFRGASDLAYIYAAKEFFIVDIISKALAFPHNEKYLKELLNQENIWLSLSFNKDFLKELDRVKSVIKDSTNANLNFCFSKKEYKMTPKFRDFLSQFQVIHLKHDKKLSISKKLGIEIDRVCGVINEAGEIINENGEKKDPSRKGSCSACPNCHVSFRNKIDEKVSELIA
jgi:hypothetical protein